MEELLELKEFLVGGNINNALLLVEEMLEMSKDDKLNLEMHLAPIVIVTIFVSS